MKGKIYQGDILRIEKIKHPVLVVSKDFFNTSGEIIGCPIYNEGKEGPLHIRIKSDKVEGIAQCENITLLDMDVRGYSKVGRVNLKSIMDISDAIQGIFDYI